MNGGADQRYHRLPQHEQHGRHGKAPAEPVHAVASARWFSSSAARSRVLSVSCGLSTRSVPRTSSRRLCHPALRPPADHGSPSPRCGLRAASSARSCIWRRVAGSRAEKGSSSSTMGLSSARVRASETRWRCPPDSSEGMRCPSPARPTLASRSRRASDPGPRPGALHRSSHWPEHSPRAAACQPAA